MNCCKSAKISTLKTKLHIMNNQACNYVVARVRLIESTLKMHNVISAIFTIYIYNPSSLSNN